MIFNCIVVDPRGKYVAKGGRTVDAAWWNRTEGKTVKIPYPTMTIDEIKALPIPSAKDAHLYLWTVNRHVEDAYAVE